LLAGIIVDFTGGGDGSVYALLLIIGKYTLTVVATLLFLAYVLYPTLLYFFSGYPIKKFFKAISPAQMLAFSTSSSAATLPLTMQCLEENIGVSKEVSGFVLPLGATINMDGTSCYQAVAAVFIANVLGYDLSLVEQLGIVMTATLASIGSAAVPGAGIVMLAIVLAHLGVPEDGIGLILGVDRILDMCRTVVNVTGDASVAVLIDKHGIRSKPK
jgi:Na+/H+-dicarboxylate symporter